jgi:hypothetical protein
MLSQVAHSTPIGLLHTVRFREQTWHGNDVGPEMLGLALDKACLGSAHPSVTTPPMVPTHPTVAGVLAGQSFVAAR